MPLLVIALLAGGLATTGFAADADADALGRAELLARQRALVAARADDRGTPPFSVETSGEDDNARGHVFTTVAHGFQALAAELGRPSSWCEIAPLHLNVKSCTWSQSHDGAHITLYSGRKTYERPENTHVSPYVFERIESRDDYLRVLLTADEGPLDTRDYVIELEAIPAGEGESFVHLRYAYRYGLKTRLAMASYFATLGSGKVGFSVIGADDEGNAVYVGGVDGMIERNAVRYQLAIQAYLDTLEDPEPVRFERRIERWFELTERHRRQLYELDRVEYLQNKRREHSDQMRLQRAAAATLRP